MSSYKVRRRSGRKPYLAWQPCFFALGRGGCTAANHDCLEVSFHTSSSALFCEAAGAMPPLFPSDWPDWQSGMAWYGNERSMIVIVA